DLPARERGVGVIFQSYALFPKMTVEKNIGYGLRIRKRRRKEIRETVKELLSLVQLEEHRKKYPSQLSGGQQQRVAIARTLAYKPQVLLFDEPFGALDTQTRSHLRREIRALLKKVRVPAIFITHDQEEALELGDRVALLNQGHIEQIGTPYEIYNHPATEYVATFLGAANILEATVGNNVLEVGSSQIPATLDTAKFRQGDCVKIVFRPEDVSVCRSDLLRPGLVKISTASIEEITFVGAFERIRLRLERGGDECRTDETPYFLTTETPERAKAIIATRPKPEAVATRLQVGERVVVSINSFTVLEPQTHTDDTKK
ncbi:MAG TPA: ABC transporter ATP-binding protein, partial [Pyrinomonadaceae bacterium]|nr:ABC transporter ATP-binding protein [Pyrinomonadaceae bacterium]